MLTLGHPWVIADRYTARWPPADPGDLIRLEAEDGTVLGTALYDRGARIVARRLSTATINLDTRWLISVLDRASRGRGWLALGDTTAVRLVNAEGDGLPGVTIDRYGDFLLVQYYTSAWEQHLPILVEALQAVFSPRGVYGKHRPHDTRKLAAGAPYRASLGRLLAGDKAPQQHTVLENGLQYQVDLVRDLHTGLFLDQRQNRLEFRRLSAGCNVLNLFAYTGAFSVAAAVGGAEQVTSVDASSRYLEWARDNFRLNDIPDGDHEFITGDCFQELDRLSRQGRSYDIILMDPPSFSTTGRSRFTTGGGTAELVEKALQLLLNGGLLVTSSNLQKMSLPDYLKQLRLGCSRAGRHLQVLKIAGQSEDFPFTVGFPEGQYLKYVVSVVQEKI